MKNSLKMPSENSKRNTHHKVIVIGSGPAAHTAAIYLGRALLKPLLFEGFMAAGVAAGGQLTTTTDVENFPGFPDGISGPELMDRMRQQSINCGTTIISKTVDRVDLSSRPFLVGIEDADEGEEDTFTCDALIIATGATARRLFLPGEDTFWQKGVSACAVCDGAAPIFRNKVICVIGGGDSASEEANFLTKYASKVIVLVRKPRLRASAVMAKRMYENDKITILFNTVATSLIGTTVLEGINVKNVMTGEESLIKASGLFYAIGHDPNTQIFKKQLALDENGYIITEGKSTKTNVPGVFACGDVQDVQGYRQAITSAGSGCMSSLNAEHFLSG